MKKFVVANAMYHKMIAQQISHISIQMIAHAIVM